MSPAIPVTNCGLCSRPCRGMRLAFSATERVAQRPPTRVRLELPLCQECANRVYKHLKRAIPKHLFCRVGEASE